MTRARKPLSILSHSHRSRSSRPRSSRLRWHHALVLAALLLPLLASSAHAETPGGGSIVVTYLPVLEYVEEFYAEGSDYTVVDVYFVNAIGTVPLPRQWTLAVISWDECELNETGAISRTQYTVTTDGTSIRLAGESNATWMENIVVTARFYNQGSYWVLWEIEIPAAYNEKYYFEVRKECGQQTVDSTTPIAVEFDYPSPDTGEPSMTYFYQDKDRLDTIMEDRSDESLRTRAAFYAYALSFESRINNTADRLVRTTYADPTAYLYALECLDWTGYALTESGLVKTFAKEWPGGMNLTTLEEHAGLMWINYECEAYLAIAAQLQQQGIWPDVVDWAMDRVFYLYNATYGTYQPASAPPLETEPTTLELLLENLMIVAGLAGVVILLPALVWRHPALIVLSLVCFALAGADWLGWI